LINFKKKKRFFLYFSLYLKGDHSQGDTIEALQEELQNRSQRIDEIINEKNSVIDQCERQIDALQLNIQDREHKLDHTNEKLAQAEEKIDVKLLYFLN